MPCQWILGVPGALGALCYVPARIPSSGSVLPWWQREHVPRPAEPVPEDLMLLWTHSAGGGSRVR